MTFTSFTRLLCLAAIFSGFSTYCLVYKISVWQHKKTEQQVFIIHTLSADLVGSQRTEQQRLELLNAMRDLQGHAIYLDLTDYVGNEPVVLAFIAAIKANSDRPTGGLIALLDAPPADYFDYASITSWQPFSGKTILTDLGKSIHKLQLSSVNLECRYAILASCMGHPINLNQVLATTKELVSSVKSFNDAPAYNTFYEERIACFESTNQDILSNQEVAIPINFEQTLAQSAVLLPFIRLVHYGQELCDAKIVHELFLAKNRKNIFLILPADNAEPINDAMPSFDYQQTYSLGEKYWRDALQSRIAFYPIDIPAVFKQYGCSFD